MPTQRIRSISSPIITTSTWWQVIPRQPLPEDCWSTCPITTRLRKRSHPTEPAYREARIAGAAYDPRRFVDPDGYRRAVEGAENACRRQLAEEKAGKQ